MIQGKVPKYGIATYHSKRYGGFDKVPAINTKGSHLTTTKLQKGSLSVWPIQLFATMPTYIRN